MENSIFEMADKLKELKEKKKALDSEMKTINAEIEFTETELSDAMINEEMQNFSRAGTLFYLNTKTHASAIPEFKEALYNTLKIEGYGDMVYETVNANSLSAFVKEQILINEDKLPWWLDGLVHVYEKTTVGLRKG